jgi:hypothetical protein
MGSGRKFGNVEFVVVTTKAAAHLVLDGGEICQQLPFE